MTAPSTYLAPICITSGASVPRQDNGTVRQCSYDVPGCPAVLLLERFIFFRGGAVDSTRFGPLRDICEAVRLRRSLQKPLGRVINFIDMGCVASGEFLIFIRDRMILYRPLLQNNFVI